MGFTVKITNNDTKEEIFVELDYLKAEKHYHSWDIIKKNAVFSSSVSRGYSLELKGYKDNPNFEEEYQKEYEKL